MNQDKKRALEAAISKIEKEQGKGAIQRLGSNGVVPGIKAIPSGSINLDIATGVGGFPRGRVVEIYGPESSGKTTLSLNGIAQAQKRGGIAAFIDAEHAIDVGYASRLGVDVDDLLISQPDSGEQALEIVEILIRSGALDIVVVDSVSALTPKAELEGDMGASLPGLQARLMSQAMRKLTAAIAKSDTTLIFINQLRMKIGVMFGNPETTTGGNALKFYSSMRLDIRKIDNIKDGTTQIGGRVRVKVVKNKVAPPFRQAEFDVLYTSGISKEGELIELGDKFGIIDKAGSWYSYNGARIGQGLPTAKEYLVANPALAAEIEAKILAAAKVTPAKVGEMPEEEKKEVLAEDGKESEGSLVAAEAEE